jgi:hypothetical protein
MLIKQEYSLTKKLSAKIIMGNLSIRQRLLLIWWIILGKVVTFDGDTVLSTCAELIEDS